MVHIKSRRCSPLHVVLLTSLFSNVFSQDAPASTPDCYTGPSYWYRGTFNLTQDGVACQRWDANSPHKIAIKPDDDDIHHNYCRNPDNSIHGLWCHTSHEERKWQHCGIEKCEDPNSFIYSLSRRGGISWVFSAPADPEIGVLKPDTHRVVKYKDGGSFISELTADDRGERVFFIDSSEDSLGVIDLVTNKTTTHLRGMCSGIHGLAYDWLGQHLYWTDSLRNSIMISDTNFTNVVQIYKNESEAPTGIALHPLKRRLYFTSDIEFYGAIIMADMIGHNITYLFESPSVQHVPSLTIDYKEDRLYWIDNIAPIARVMSSDLDGNDVKKIFQRTSGTFWGLAEHMDSVFVGDRRSYYDTERGQYFRVWVASKETGTRSSYHFPAICQAMTIISIDKDPSWKAVPNGCQPSNPCEQVCIPLAGDEYECACTQGYEWDSTECVSNRFLVTVDLPRKKIFQIPFDGDTESYAVLPIPATFDDRVTTIAMDTSRKLLYWFDASTVTIYKSRFNGSESQPFLVGKHAKSMAVDPSTGNVYFVDDDSGFIYVVDSNGDFPAALYRPKDNPDALNHIEDLALDLENKHVYWTAIYLRGEEDESTTMGAVMRMGFDGSDIEAVFHNIITPRVIFVDNIGDDLFVGSNGDLVYKIPLSSLKTVSGSIPSDKVLITVTELSATEPIIDLLIHDDFGYVLQRATDYITKFSLDPHPSVGSFGSTDFFFPRHLALYDSEYMDHHAAIACSELACDHLCLPTPGGEPPACRCGDGFEAADDGTCLGGELEDQPPSYNNTCPGNMEVINPSCSPGISLPPWSPPVWTDDNTPEENLRITSPEIKHFYTPGTYWFEYSALDGAENLASCTFSVSVTNESCLVATPDPSLGLTVTSTSCHYGELVHAIHCRDRSKWVRYGSLLNETIYNLCLPTFKWEITDYNELSCEDPVAATTSLVLATSLGELAMSTGVSQETTKSPEVDVGPADASTAEQSTTSQDEGGGARNKKLEVAPTGGLSEGVIAAVAVLAVFVVIVIILGIMYILKRKQMFPGGPLNPISMMWSKSSDEVEANAAKTDDRTYEKFY